ncbi:MAG: S9 family peptidase [Acidobacteria bacterium]|nr:S9 family peptidase [Acidobacteriota bacterium]
MRRISVGLLLSVFFAALLTGANKRPATEDDAMAMRYWSASGNLTASRIAPMIAPDGSAVLFVLCQWESPSGTPDAGRPGRKDPRSHLWRVSTKEPAVPEQITRGSGETAPAWSPDGRLISFLADRDGATQVWLMSADGGESWKLTEAKDGVTAYAWSPDSKLIAFTTPDPPSKEEEEKRRLRDDAQVFEHTFRYNHLWTIDVTSNGVTRVTDGRSFTVAGRPSWSPDGTRIAFSGAPTSIGRDRRADIYVADRRTRQVEAISRPDTFDSTPVWSPDGKSVAYIAQPNDNVPQRDGMPRPGVKEDRLVLFDVATKGNKEVTIGQIELPVWSPDSTRLYFGSGRGIYKEVFAYDVGRDRVTELTKGRHMVLGSTSRDGSQVAFVANSSTSPVDLYVADANLGSPRRLTRVNPQIDDLLLGEAERVTWKSFDGLGIEGVLLKPVNYTPGTRYPLLVVIHGGPDGAHMDTFKLGPFTDDGHIWAGRGWAVLYPNPRGSTNYGDTFLAANIGDWGGGDYRDVMAGVDALIEKGIADPNRLGVLGWSYGGYLTCRIVSQTTRFKAAVVGAGITDLYSMYGTSDLPGLLDMYFGGPPFGAKRALYQERSCVSDADRITTPVLILHGQNDGRVPLGQATELYWALKGRGKTVELVTYPRESHGPREYYHLLDRLKRQYEWISRYTLGGSTKTTE